MYNLHRGNYTEYSEAVFNSMQDSQRQAGFEMEENNGQTMY